MQYNQYGLSMDIKIFVDVVEKFSVQCSKISQKCYTQIHDVHNIRKNMFHAAF